MEVKKDNLTTAQETAIRMCNNVGQNRALEIIESVIFQKKAELPTSSEMDEWNQDIEYFKAVKNAVELID